MFQFGAAEIGLIVVVLLLCFGPSQLPKLARAIGESIRELRAAGRETRDAVKELEE